MTALQQQQDALGFVHLVKRHFDRASISLPSEVWERMNAILIGEEEALKVSQQSNPATLREALRKLLMSFDTKIEQHLNKALDEGRVKPDFRTGAFYVLHELADLLAASGTEAAPTITPEILMDAVAMVQDEGLWKFDQPKWYEAMAEALEHLRKPAQAAASPEGEGREAYPGEKFFHERNANIRNCDQFKEDVEFIHACHIEGSIDVACRQVFERREKEAFERALRQSAAPSGGEAASMLKEVCEILGVQLGPGLARYAPLIAKVRALAQESKTGAVTETK